MVRCTFSPARAWRFVVGPASPRTLGSATTLTSALTASEFARDFEPLGDLVARALRPDMSALEQYVLAGSGTDSGFADRVAEWSHAKARVAFCARYNLCCP